MRTCKSPNISETICFFVADDMLFLLLCMMMVFFLCIFMILFQYAAHNLMRHCQFSSTYCNTVDTPMMVGDGAGSILRPCVKRCPCAGGSLL